MTDINYASIEEIHGLYREKKLTVRSLVLAYLSRMAKTDSCADGLNSVLEINPDALFLADAFDEKLRKNVELTPLFGIPVLLKDNICTADRLHTSAGSVALADVTAQKDAHIVKLLREAGALILGKANMTEFANYMSRENMPSGYSSRGKQVLNPYNREKTPSGSSSGSAVAIAAGLSAVSIGTETSGSIISPAGVAGIVGIKPTLGLVGRSGIIPISNTLDTAGPMARSVRDAAVLLSVITGCDPEDPAARGHPAAYTDCFTANGCRGMRIGINRSSNEDKEEDANEETSAAFDNLCSVFSDTGASLIENIRLRQKTAAGDIMRYEFKAAMNNCLSKLNDGKIKTLGDIIQYNQAHSSAALKYGQSILIEAQNKTSGSLTEPDYINALLEREEAISELDAVFDENELDVILCESIPNVAPYTGFPSMTIPIGQKKSSEPIPAYFLAKRFGETTLIQAAYAAERILALELRPKFI